MLEHIQETVACIQKQLPKTPKLGIVLGSGLGEYADSFSNPVIIPYTDIPHFPQSTVVGHKGRLVFHEIEGLPLLAMQGRFHYYEGYSMEQVTYPIRVMGKLGIRRLILTNAAGGANPSFSAGDLMLITDHLNLMGVNPLRGPHNEEFGDRFPDLTYVYHPEDRQVFETIAQRLQIPLQKGVYAGFSGPSYETPAEVRMAQILGADAVGMSTVPEAIVATQMGIRVSGVSCVTNPAAGITGVKLAHEDVMEVANRVKQQFITLINGVIQEFAHIEA